MLNAIRALWIREVKKALASKITFVAGMALPLFFIFVLGKGIGSVAEIKGLAENIGYTEFLGPGIIVLWAIGSSLSIGQSIIQDKDNFMKELLVAPIPRFSIFIGKIAGDMTVNFVSTLILAALFLIISGNFGFMRIVAALSLLTLAATGFYGLGTVIGSLVKKAKDYQLVSGLLVTTLIFLSGVFFPITNLPIWLKVPVLVNPVTYSVDAMRHILIGYSEFDFTFSLAILSVFTASMALLGSYLFQRSTVH